MSILLRLFAMGLGDVESLPQWGTGAGALRDAATKPPV
jgi:hypothetical protein